MNTRYTCLIADDEIHAIELLSDTLHDLYGARIDIVRTCTHWREALETLQTDAYDLVFLDISMQGRSGIGLVKCVPDLQSEVIFITAYEQYALEAYKVMAAGYIVKPFNDIELAAVTDKAMKRIKNKRIAQHEEQAIVPVKNNKLGIPNGNAIEYVNAEDIIYLEADGAYTRVVFGNKEILSSYNLGKFKEILDSQLFYQIHRSFLLNLNHVSRYENGVIHTSLDKMIPVARSSREAFLKLFKRVNGGA